MPMRTLGYGSPIRDALPRAGPSWSGPHRGRACPGKLMVWHGPNDFTRPSSTPPAACSTAAARPTAPLGFGERTGNTPLKRWWGNTSSSGAPGRLNPIISSSPTTSKADQDRIPSNFRWGRDMNSTSARHPRGRAHQEPEIYNVFEPRRSWDGPSPSPSPTVRWAGIAHCLPRLNLRATTAWTRSSRRAQFTPGEGTVRAGPALHHRQLRAGQWPQAPAPPHSTRVRPPEVLGPRPSP